MFLTTYTNTRSKIEKSEVKGRRVKSFEIHVNLIISDEALLFVVNDSLTETNRTCDMKWWRNRNAFVFLVEFSFHLEEFETEMCDKLEKIAFKLILERIIYIYLR